jgi:hypothetical protein
MLSFWNPKSTRDTFHKNECVIFIVMLALGSTSGSLQARNTGQQISKADSEKPAPIRSEDQKLFRGTNKKRPLVCFSHLQSSRYPYVL